MQILCRRGNLAWHHTKGAWDKVHLAGWYRKRAPGDAGRSLYKYKINDFKQYMSLYTLVNHLLYVI